MQPLDPGDPAEIGPYRLLEVLGEGSMGRVFLGEAADGSRVAVKVIRAEPASDPRFRVRFAREVEAARRVGGHHTAQVVEADPDAASPWFATAHVPGPSMTRMIAQGGPLVPRSARRVAGVLAEGLAAIHACGLVHRDLKPANVIMAEGGPRIIDFGLAKITDATALTTAGTAVGTFAFMAPEQMRGEEVGPAADVYALGCVLVYLATGRAPLDAGTVPELVRRVLTEEPRLDAVPPDLRDIAARCLAKDASARPPVPVLVDWLAGDPARPRPVPGAFPARGPVPRRALLAGAASVAGLVAVGGAWALLRGDDASGGAPAAADPARSGGPDGSVLLAGPNILYALAFSPDGRALVGADSSEVWRWDPATRRGGVAVRLAATGLIQPKVFSTDLTTLARADRSEVTLWDVATGKAGTVIKETANVRAVALSADGRTVATSSGDDVVLTEVGGGDGRRVPTGLGGVGAMGFSPDGRLLVCGSNNHTVLLRMPDGERLAKLSYCRANAVAFTADGGTLAAGTTTGAVKLVDVAAGRVTAELGEEQMFRGPGMVEGVAFSPDGRTVAAGHVAPGSATVRLWDVASGQTTRTLADAAPPLAYAPDGRLATRSYDRDGVLLWTL